MTNIDELIERLLNGATSLPMACRDMEQAADALQSLITENERLREELAKANNEFGCETADWPEVWRRVADLKEYAHKQRSRAEAAEAAEAKLERAMEALKRMTKTNPSSVAKDYEFARTTLARLQEMNNDQS